MAEPELQAAVFLGAFNRAINAFAYIIAVLCNKADLPNALPLDELKSQLQVQAFPAHITWFVLDCETE